jgi:eukaryotic-like serine/threonine-protein kinase
MPAPATRDDLLTLIRGSGLITARQLDDALAACDSTDLNVILTKLVLAGLITEFQGKELYAGRNRGFFIGKYKVLRPLAAGGMGLVLHCEHIHMGHQVALKLLPRDHAGDKQSVTRFYREARAVAAVRHPNIVKAFDVGQEGPWHCLVMEYVEGINFYRLVNRFGPLSELETAHTLAQICKGLQEIMTSGLVHRDLKPGNLLVDREGTVRILDLGLARFTDERADDLTKELNSRSVLGTADFVSPEQALRSHDVDIRSDIYALGMTAYFLLTGKLPFPGGTLASKLMAHQTRMPQPIEEHRTSLSPELRAIVLKMIQKKPEDRYQTPKELEQALEHWTSQPAPKPNSDWFEKAPVLRPVSISKGGSQTTVESHSTRSEKPKKAKPLIRPLPNDPPTVITGAIPVRVVSADSVKMTFESDDDPLAALRDLSTYPRGPRSARKTSSSFRLHDRTRRQLLLAGAVALPILAGLSLALWFYVNHKPAGNVPRSNGLSLPTRR